MNFILDTYPKYNCGGNEIPQIFPDIVHIIVTIIQIIVPVIIIILGMIDMGKAVMAQKEDEIKKGKDTLIKRIILGMCVFLVFVFVKMFVKVLAPTNNQNIWNCVDCFISGNCGVEVDKD